MQSQIELSFSNAFSMKTITDRKWRASTSFLVSGDLNKILKHSNTDRSPTGNNCAVTNATVRAARCVFHWSIVRLWLTQPLKSVGALAQQQRKASLTRSNSAMQSVLESNLSSHAAPPERLWPSSSHLLGVSFGAFPTAPSPWSDGASWHWPSHQPHSIWRWKHYALNLPSK